MVGSLVRRVLCAAVLLAACSTGGVATEETQLTLVPNPDTSDTLLPVITDAVETDDTGTLPPDALFGGDLCSALDASDFSGLGRVRDTSPLSLDSCQWTVSSGVVIVKLATPDDFARPGTADEEIAPVDGVGLDAIGVAHADNYQVYVRVENGHFSVTAPTEDAAVRLAAAAAPRATAAPPPATSTTEPPSSTEAAPTTT
jgi:hypothetical protein